MKIRINKFTAVIMIGGIAACIFGVPIDSAAQQLLSDSPAEIDSNAFYFDRESLTRRQLSNLPFRNESQEYYGLFSGTVVQEFRGTDYLHIRGSRPDEISYTFEGIDVRSSFTGLNMMRFIPEALESITLHGSPTAGTDHAVASVEHRLRRGRGNFNFTMRGESDQIAADNETRFGTFSYGYTNLLLMAEGRVFSDNIHFFAAAERETFGDHYRKFWDGFRIGGPDFPLFDINTGETLQEIVGTDEIVILPGNIPEAAASRTTINSVISADAGAFSIGIVGLFNSENEQQNELPIYNNFNLERIPELKQNTGLLSLQTDYTGPDALSAHIQFDILRSNERSTDPIDGDDLLSPSGIFENSTTFRILNFPFNHPGRVLSDFTRAEENYRGFSGSVRKKIGRHFITGGGAFQRRNVRRFTIKSYLGFIRELQGMGLMPSELSDEQLLRIRERGDVQAFGYDVFGNSIEHANVINDGPRRPVEYSLFLEDQFRTKSFQMQLGLRYDSFSSDARIYRNPALPVDFSKPGNPNLATAPTYRYLLPRLAAAFFAGDRLTFQFNFGRYVQQARFRDVYASRQHRAWPGSKIENDPRGFDSEPVPSTQSVFSLSYRVNSMLLLETSIFHKKISEQLLTDLVVVDRASRTGNYMILANNGSSTARGAEFTLRLKLRRLKARLNYTLSAVEGSASYPISNLQDGLRSDFNSDREKLDRISEESTPLDFNQRHRGSALISYRTGKKAPAWMQNTGLHLLFRFNGGHNFRLYDGLFG